jgi:hypothetical protein
MCRAEFTRLKSIQSRDFGIGQEYTEQSLQRGKSAQSRVCEGSTVYISGYKCWQDCT